MKFLLITKGNICKLYKEEIIQLQEYIKETFKNFELLVISLMTSNLFGKDATTHYSGSQKHEIYSERNNKKIDEKIKSKSEIAYFHQMFITI